MPIKPEMAEKRIASLDGLRALSIGLVILYHLGQTLSFSWSKVVRAIADNGFFGVQIFFVISGFLITWLLLVEEAKYGRFSLSAFYGRRALRILPPALFYLLVVAGLTAVGVAEMSKLDFLASALFFRNLIPGMSIETGHYWTLSIEEQFYLIWPFLLIVIRNNKIRLWLLVALMVIGPIWRHQNHLWAGGAEKVNYGRLDMRSDPLIMGCLLALVRFDKTWLARLRKPILQNPFTALALTALLAFELVAPIPKILLTFSLGIECICVALLMSYVIDKPSGLAGKILNFGPVAWIGTLSYSLYIWNQLFLKHYPDHPFWIRQFPQNLAATLLCSCFSYYVLEQPFSRLRRTLFTHAKQPVPQATA
jgi:peptidoglycan/LPS O-acetylase OafA/YrhL